MTTANLYQNLLSDLGIGAELLVVHQELILEKLLHAAGELDQVGREQYATNQVLHLASSLVLRFGQNLEAVLARIRTMPGLVEKDYEETTIITIAALYYMLTATYPEANVAAITRLQGCLRDQQWIIGPAKMQILGIC